MKYTYLYHAAREGASLSLLCHALQLLYRGPAHGDIFRIFPSGSSHVRGQQCTVAIEEKRFSHRGAATQAVILKTVCLL